MPGKKEFKYNNGISLKEIGGTHYIEGFVSTPEYDLESDRYLNQADIVEQINANSEAKKGSIHHDRSGSALLLAEHAELKTHPKLDKECAWIRTVVNSDHPSFTSTINEVEKGFIDGFSLEFLGPEVVGVEGEDFVWNGREVGDHRGRDIFHAPIIGYGLASRGINPTAEITNHYTKEFIEKKEKSPQDIVDNVYKNPEVENKMTDENKAPVEEPKDTNPPEEEKKEEAKEEEKPAEAPAEAAKAEEPKEDAKEEKEFKNEFKAQFKEAFQASFKEMMDTKKPLNVKENHLDAQSSDKISGTIKNYKEAMKLSTPAINLKEQRESYESTIDVQYKAANDLVNAIPAIYDRSMPTSAMQTKENWQCNKSFINYKALTAHDSPTNAETTYYQATAELNDVYQPVVYSQLNDATTLWGILTKEDMSGSQMIQFRANDAAGITAAGYNEGDTTWTPTNWSLKKFEQAFAYYRSIIEVTDQMIISAGSGGGIGDVFGAEVERATTELLKKLNTDILQGAGGTYDGTDSQYLLGFQHLIINTGNLYGKARSSIATLQGTDEAMSSAELSLTQMRKMKRISLKNGAMKRNLAYVTSYLLTDKYRSIMQNMQRMVPTSARAGFEGRPELDGIPVFEDQHADDDDMFLVDFLVTKAGIQRPPTLIEFGRTGDTRKAAIVMYFNLYCTNPNHNYWSSGFATT